RDGWEARSARARLTGPARVQLYLIVVSASGKSPSEASVRLRVALTVNGETRELITATHKTLLEVLREDLDLTGTKHGCELGECGTCTVLVDGEPVLSCLALAVETEGRRITTVEGMAEGGRLSARARYAARSPCSSRASPCCRAWRFRSRPRAAGSRRWRGWRRVGACIRF